jgi:flagellar protein FliS
MLYDGARRFLRQAAVAMRNGEVERGHNTLRRAELIVGHLDATLDFDQGLVAERLHAIYMYCLEQLAGSRYTQDADKLDDVSGLLGDLREAWGQIADEPAPV